MADRKKVALTGFMGVGKSSVARHLANFAGVKRCDLDRAIEEEEHRTIAAIIDTEGEAAYRLIETANLKRVIALNSISVLSLGGGTWTIAENREILKAAGFNVVWLEATFEHCWMNITYSRKDRPLARDKNKALDLFNERQKLYCLADWHFVIRPGTNSYEVAKQINEEIFL
jgi:shikimate kinase